MCLLTLLSPCCFQLVVYAGRNIFAPKLCEYGGNTFGVGSSSVLGEGWPREPVKVEGESVTFSFQVKSGRERATQDNAVWGFHCTITAKVGGWGAEGSGRGRKHAEGGTYNIVAEAYCAQGSSCCSDKHLPCCLAYLLSSTAGEL